MRASFEPGSRVLEITGGAQHVLARLENGQVYSWGANGAGQLGFQAHEEPSELCEEAPCSTVPTPVYALSHVIGTAAGENASFALKEEEGGARVVYSWGGTGHWELWGLGNLPFETTPTPTPNMSLPSVAAISASSTMGLALLEGGSPPTPLLTASPTESGAGPRLARVSRAPTSSATGLPGRGNSAHPKKARAARPAQCRWTACGPNPTK